ncbi:MAG: sucrose phosphorylase [Dermatophilaceae bacterium]
MGETKNRQNVQLIAYADRFGGSLPGLHEILNGPLAGLFAGVHLLPFFTPFDGADAGFDPVDHCEVDLRLGSWHDVRALAGDYKLMFDLIVNHVSAESVEFRDVVARGDDSPYAGMFLTMSDVYPDGAGEDELAGIYRPRPGLPFTTLRLGERRRLVWTTFTGAQIDLNLANPTGRAYLNRVLLALAGGGASMVRLDAVGYAIKTPGTSSFMTAHTMEFITELTARARELGVQVLVEIHGHYERQIAIGSAVDRVYDFALPPLLLHGLFTGDAAPLRRWLEVRPVNAVTVLDTHDGIGVIDVGPDQMGDGRPGLLTLAQVDALVEGIHVRSGGQSRQATGWAASNVDVYQVNCTYYDALGRDDAAYLLARAVQFFTPGIPQVYYVGLLAGHNDMDLLARSGVGRDINRHNYVRDEIDRDLARPVVIALVALIRFRNGHPALAGRCLAGGEGSRLTLTWTAGEHSASLDADLGTGRATITWTGPDGEANTCKDLLRLRHGY